MIKDQVIALSNLSSFNK